MGGKSCWLHQGDRHTEGSQAQIGSRGRWQETLTGNDKGVHGECSKMVRGSVPNGRNWAIGQWRSKLAAFGGGEITDNEASWILSIL